MKIVEDLSLSFEWCTCYCEATSLYLWWILQCKEGRVLEVRPYMCDPKQELPGGLLGGRFSLTKTEERLRGSFH